MTLGICDFVLDFLDKPLEIHGDVMHQPKYNASDRGVLEVPAGFSLFTNVDVKFKYITATNGKDEHAAQLYITLPTKENKLYLDENPDPNQDELNNLDRIIFLSPTDENGNINAGYGAVNLGRECFIYVNDENEKLTSKTEKYIHNKEILNRGSEVMLQVMDVFEAQKYIDNHLEELKVYLGKQNPSMMIGIKNLFLSFF